MSEDKKEWDILDVATQATQFIEKNFKILLGLFIVAILAGSLWSYTRYVSRQNEMKAFSELYKITKVYDEKKSNFEKASEQAKKKTDKSKDKVAESENQEKLSPATGELEKDYPQVVKDLESFIDSHLGLNASGEAALVLSEIYDKYDQQQKGAEVIAKVLKDWDSKDVLYYVMQMRSGDLWASRDQCDKAVPFWQVVANGESFITRQAQLKLGVCLQKLGRIDEAKQWYTRITEKEPNSSEGFSAKRYLRFLEFKTKSGEETSDDKAQINAKKKDSHS